MRRLFPSFSVGSVVLAMVALVAPAQAQETTEGASSTSSTKCAPGSWFCAEVSTPPRPKPAAEASAPGGTTVIVNQAPPADTAKAAKKTVPVDDPPLPPRYEPPPEPSPLHHSEWGLQAHLLGALLGKRADSQSGMGGFGFALRARPTSYVAIDLGVDFLGGRDYNGRRRAEIPLSLNTLFFVNPRDKVQVYFLGGLGLSSARVAVGPQTTAHYGYFGVQGGAGLEFRVGRKLALNADLTAFLRGRIDDLAMTSPEFTDPTTGRKTNTSGGGLFRGGLTFYW